LENAAGASAALNTGGNLANLSSIDDAITTAVARASTIVVGRPCSSSVCAGFRRNAGPLGSVVSS